MNGPHDLTTKLVASALGAAAATTLAQTAIARAEPYSGSEFGDPSKNIACILRLYTDGENTAQCDIDKHTWVGPQSGPGSCSGTGGYIFMLREAGAPEISCMTQGEVLSTIYFVLDYGQTKSVGAITCDSEPSGITCTNTSTGHFYRVSRDSYQVG